jgi:hypothetical protein
VFEITETERMGNPSSAVETGFWARGCVKVLLRAISMVPGCEKA